MSPSPDEVLVRVHATTVNRTDCANLTARPFIMRLIVGLFRPRRRTPGTDLAGVVTAVGSDVTAFAEGDRVWAFKDTGLSSQAEVTACKADAHLARMPEGVGWAEAAASVEGAHYARNFLNKVTIARGQSVLLTPLGRGRRVAFPFPGGMADSLAFVRARLDDGSFRPLIDRRYPLGRVREAYEYVCSGQKLGNVVLETGPSQQEDHLTGAPRVA